MSEHVLLVCTVGGSPEPLVAALKHWQPQRVLFLASPESCQDIESNIMPECEAEGHPLDPGRFDTLVLPDAQDFAGCVEKIRESNHEVTRWLARGEGFTVVVDFTGGTKCMTAALALHAHRWACRFSYVGGAERTKSGVGVVVSGSEKILHTQNPWDALGYQAVEDFVFLFDQGDFDPAVVCLTSAFRKVTDPARKGELAALKTLAEAYAAWERFDHKKAANLLGNLAKQLNNLRAIFPAHRVDGLMQQVAAHAQHLEALSARRCVTRLLVVDLLANARRRANEGRFDDAVARLYRATEALAQLRLSDGYGISDTNAVPLDKIPNALRREWSSRAENGTVFLGLQDAYTLLAELRDPLAEEFHRLQWHDHSRSPLTARNQSILAHGFDPASQKVWQQLWRGCLQLVDITEADLPVFPSIGRD